MRHKNDKVKPDPTVSAANVGQEKGKNDVGSDSSEHVTQRNATKLDERNDVTSSPRLTGAILAGGRSSRMGRDKALLHLDGKPMIARVLEAVRDQVEEIMVVSNRPETYAFLNVPVYPDVVESCGPLAGIYTALAHSTTHHCLVLACDLPFLSRRLLRFMCENCAPYDVFMFESASGLEPLCAVYSKACLPEIQAQIQKGEYKVSEFFDRVHTRIVHLESGLPSCDTNALFNVNTPKELARARKLVRRHGQR